MHRRRPRNSCATGESVGGGGGVGRGKGGEGGEGGGGGGGGGGAGGRGRSGGGGLKIIIVYTSETIILADYNYYINKIIIVIIIYKYELL